MTLTTADRKYTMFSPVLTVLRDVLARPSGAIGLTLVTAHLVLALISPLIVPYDFKATNSSMMLTGPDMAHWLGTDHMGRDVFTRVLLGGREALLVTGIATPIAVTWGGFMGIFFGLAGGSHRRSHDAHCRCLPLLALDPQDARPDRDLWHRRRSLDSNAGLFLRHSGHPHRSVPPPTTLSRATSFPPRGPGAMGA